MSNTEVRTIKSLDLYEVSWVFYPANPYCTLLAIGGVVREVHSDSEVV